MKLIIFKHDYDIILYINCVFYFCQIRIMVAMTNLVLVLRGQKSGERLKDHWFSGLNFVLIAISIF